MAMAVLLLFFVPTSECASLSNLPWLRNTASGMEGRGAALIAPGGGRRRATGGLVVVDGGAVSLIIRFPLSLLM